MPPPRPAFCTAERQPRNNRRQMPAHILLRHFRQQTQQSRLVWPNSTACFPGQLLDRTRRPHANSCIRIP